MDVSIRELPKDHSLVAVQYAYSMLWRQTVDWVSGEQQRSSIILYKQRLQQVAKCLRCGMLSSARNIFCCSSFNSTTLLSWCPASTRTARTYLITPSCKP
jgi:hypothetical protein